MHASAARMSIAVGLVAAALALAGCGGGSTSPSASPAPQVSTIPPETPKPTPSPVETNLPQSDPQIPTDCQTLASPETRAAAIGDLTLQSNGEGFVRPVPEGATLRLGCDWFTGDTTGILLLISTAAPEAVTAALGQLPAQGYTCQAAEDFGAQYCQLPGTGPDTEETITARDGVWIYMSTSNRNGRAFLSEIVSGIFG